MRSAIVRLSRFVLCSALAVVIGVSIQTVAHSQDDATPPAEGTGETATETTGDAAAPADGEKPQVSAQEVLEKGQEALKSGDFQAALGAFDQIARAGETQMSEDAFKLRLIGYTGRGQALAGLKEYDAALEDFKLALDLNENFAPALIARGQMLLDLGGSDNYATALSDFQKAIKAERGNPAAQFGLGKSLALTGNYQAAIGPLTRIIEIAPDSAEAYRLRGTAYSGVFKPKEAIADLNKSIELDPEEYETYFTLGAIDFRNENYKGAIEQFGKAIDHYKPKDPNDTLPFVQGILTRASIYIELGKTLKDPAARKVAFQGAIDDAERVLAVADEKNPSMGPLRSSALYARGLGERMQGDLHKAIRTFSEAIELNPDLAEAYFRRGICYHYLNEETTAIADFVESANINFEDPRANLWEGFTHAKMGNYQEALRAYGNAIAASDRYTPAYLNRGLAYMALGEYEKALADFNDAVRLEPTNPDYYFRRGIAHEQLGNSQKAAESFAAAIEFQSNHGPAFRHLADAMQRLGRTELANQYRARATELEPADNAQ